MRGQRILLAGVCLGLYALAVASGVTPAYAVTAQAIDYPGAEGAMPAHLYLPEGTGRRPGVLVLHTVAGPGPNLEAFARALAGEGYVTMTPDVFDLHDFGPEGRTDHPLLLKDLQGALELLRSHPQVDPARIGVVGFSFGGRLAVRLAATFPRAIRATVSYYAVTSHQALGRPLAGRAARAKPLTAHVDRLAAPVLLHHGEADARVPADQSRLLHDALVAAGKPSTLHIYPNADHLFNFALGSDVRHHPEADRLSWERTVRFLEEHLKEAAGRR